MFKDNNSPTWVVAYASVIGNGHLLMNLPCQDSNVHKKLNNTWGVAVVADGAGSAAKSDIGSDFVSRNIAHCLEEVIKRNGWQDLDHLPTESEWRTEAIKVMQIVRQRLDQFSAAKEYKISDLACTLLAILYTPFCILTVHIGDGRAAYSVEPGKWEALIEPFRGNEVNQTVFITSNCCLAHEGHDMIFTPLFLNPRLFKISKPTLTSSSGSLFKILAKKDSIPSSSGTGVDFILLKSKFKLSVVVVPVSSV